jgi:anti-sigma factor (TIGR02949 family)
MSELDRYTCLETVERLADYLDRELSAAETVEVERHLSTCERCLGRFQFEAAVLDELRTKLRRVSVPETLAERLREALRRSATG